MTNKEKRIVFVQSNNEELGWRFEKLLCDIYKIPNGTSTGKVRSLYNDTNVDLCKFLSNNVTPLWNAQIKPQLTLIKHVASNSNAIDFKTDLDESVNTKITTSPSAKCAPNLKNDLSCQTSYTNFAKTWMGMYEADVTNLSENDLKILYSDYIHGNYVFIVTTMISHFLSDDHLIYYNIYNGTLSWFRKVVPKVKVVNGKFKIEITKEHYRSKKSCTIYFEPKGGEKKISIAEFQKHTNRKQVTLRLFSKGLQSMIQSGHIEGSDLRVFNLPQCAKIKTKKQNATVSNTPIVEPEMKASSVDYIGSKSTLNPIILQKMLQVIQKESLKGMSFIDAMSGSGSISEMAINNECSKVLSNDIMEICRLAASCLTIVNVDRQKLDMIIMDVNEQFEQFDKVLNIRWDDVLTHNDWICNHLSGQHDENGNPVHAKKPNMLDIERLYFTKMNGYKIDTARRYIEELRDNKQLNEHEYDHLVYAVVIAASKVGNVSSQWGAYFGKFKKAALKPLQLKLPVCAEKSSQVEHTVCKKDIIELLQTENHTYDILYCDPPYNKRRYDTNYHILNYIAQYNDVEYKEDTKTAVPKHSDDNNTRFTSTSAKQNLEKLLEVSPCKYFFMSYSSESLVTKDDVLTIIKKHYVDSGVFEIPYKRFKAQKKTKENTVTEYLFWGKR